jgi:hypothetical protein
MHTVRSCLSGVMISATVAACSFEKDAVVIGAEVPVYAEAKEAGEPVTWLKLGDRVRVKAAPLGDKDWLSLRFEDEERFVQAKHVTPLPLTGAPYYAVASGKVGHDQALPAPDVVIGDTFQAVPLSTSPATLVLGREGQVVGAITANELSTGPPTIADFKADLLRLLETSPRSPVAREVAKRAGAQSDADLALKELIGLWAAAQDAAGVEEIWLKLGVGGARGLDVAAGQDRFIGSPLALLRETAAEKAAPVNILRINARVRVLELQKPRARVALLLSPSPEETPATNSIEAPGDRPWVNPVVTVETLPTDDAAPRRLTHFLKAEPRLVGWVDMALLTASRVRPETLRQTIISAGSAGGDRLMELLAIAAFLSPLDTAVVTEAYAAALKAGRFDLGFALLQVRERQGPVFAGLTGAATLALDALQMGTVAYVDSCRGAFLWAAMRSDGELEDGTCRLIDRQSASSFVETVESSLPEGVKAPAAGGDEPAQMAARAATTKNAGVVDNTRRVRIRLRNTTARYGGLGNGVYVASINVDPQCSGRPTAQVTTWRVPVPALGPYEVLDLWVIAAQPIDLAGSAVIQASNDVDARVIVEEAVGAAESGDDIGGSWGMGFVGDLPKCQDEYAEPEED